jgi:hypothetical protein
MLFPNQILKQRTAKSRLKSLTLKGFGGGLNAVDDEYSMAPRFAVTLKNFRRAPSGGQQLRYGSSWFADVAASLPAGGTILDKIYFNGRLIVVATSGNIVTVSDSGVVTTIWSTAIAALLPGAPSAWGSAFTTVNFVPFKDTLIIHNGKDKPLSISSVFKVTYLQDLATGSNVNVPIGKYGCVASNYHCVGGIPGSPTTIYITAVGTSGTFPGDPVPNDAISIDVGAYAPQGAVSIRGMIGFRSYLIIFFQGQTILVTLGVYNASGIHSPTFPDTLPKFGLLGHRCMTFIEQELIFAGLDGFSDAKRNLFSGLINSQHVSDRIEPLYRSIIGNLTDLQQLEQCFMVYDSLWHDTILFNPNGRCLVHTGSTGLHYDAWSEFNFPTNWSCACQSFLGRVFYSTGTKIFQHGNAVFANENYHADRMNDRDKNWARSTVFTAGQLVRSMVTNVALQSDTFNVAPWTITAATVLWAPNTIDPLNSNNAWLLKEDTTIGSQHKLDQLVTVVAGVTYTRSIYLKNNAGKTYVSLRAYSNPTTATGVTVRFNLVTGEFDLPTVAGTATQSYNAIQMLNGWWRVSHTINMNNAETGVYLRLSLLQGDGSSDASIYDGDGTTGVVIFGNQLEASQSMGAYVPTTTAAVTGDGAKSYTCSVSHTSGTTSMADDIAANPSWWAIYNGISIPFEMELPWMSGREPMKIKQLRFVAATAIGVARFTVEVYVDGLYKDDNGNIMYNPALMVEFVGNSMRGFGYDDGPYGGGRVADDPRLWGFPVKFKILKVKVFGTSTKTLQVNDFSFLYSEGQYKR